MGQKTNPTILRLGKTNNWESKYSAKKTIESPTYLTKNLEIKNFILKYFKNNGLNVHHCKIYHLDGSLHIFLSYYNILKSIFIINKGNKIQNLQFYKKKPYYLNSKIKKYRKYKEINYLRNIKRYSSNFKKIKKVINFNETRFKIRRMESLKSIKHHTLTKNFKSLNNIFTNSFLENFFESLTQFTKRKSNVFLTLKKLNKNIKKTVKKESYKKFRKYFTQLRKYNRNSFFNEGVNILFSSIINRNTAQIISEFIAEQFKKIKKHNFFLRFVKTTLSLFINSTFSNIKGIKIKIKGRINGAPRAKHRTIKVGNNLPILTINQKINYSETTSFTRNGTLGIKVWVCEM